MPCREVASIVTVGIRTGSGLSNLRAAPARPISMAPTSSQREAFVFACLCSPASRRGLVPAITRGRKQHAAKWTEADGELLEPDRSPGDAGEADRHAGPQQFAVRQTVGSLPALIGTAQRIKLDVVSISRGVVRRHLRHGAPDRGDRRLGQQRLRQDPRHEHPSRARVRAGAPAERLRGEGERDGADNPAAGPRRG